MLANQIRKMRTNRGITQEKLAEDMNVSRQAVAKWESGEAIPELEKLLQLADIFQVTLDEMVRGERHCTGEPAGPWPNDQRELVEFLLRAGQATYAGKGREVTEPSAPGAHEYDYTEGGWRYRDRYFGGLAFVGEETVFKNGQCRWAMNYCGRTLSEKFNPDFLKNALLKRPAAMPYRGPAFFRDGRYAYHNEVEGELDWFSGKETVFCEDELVFECRYQGGLVSAS